MTRTFKVGRHEVPETPWISPKVAVGPSPGRGAGLFATEPVSAGEIVLVWGGRSYAGAEEAAIARAGGSSGNKCASCTESAAAPVQQGARRAQPYWFQPTSNAAGRDAAALECSSYSQTSPKGRGTMQWDEDLFSCEADEADDHDAFAINHSCDPNVWMQDAFRLTARRDIPANEELAMDYAMLGGEADYRSEWDCLCSAPECRGTITGLDWKLEVLQRRYAGHFIPFLNRKIAESARP